MGEVIEFKKRNKKETINDIFNREKFENINQVIEYYMNKAYVIENLDDEIFNAFTVDVFLLSQIDSKYYDTIVSLYNKVHDEHKNFEELKYASVLTNIISSNEDSLLDDEENIINMINSKLKKKML